MPKIQTNKRSSGKIVLTNNCSVFNPSKSLFGLVPLVYIDFIADHKKPGPIPISRHLKSDIANIRSDESVPYSNY